MNTKDNWLAIVILKILFSFCLCSYWFSLGSEVTILNNKVAVDLRDLGFRQRDSKGSLGRSSSLLCSRIEDHSKRADGGQSLPEDGWIDRETDR